MIFIKSNDLASAQLRCDQIASELGSKVYLNDIPYSGRDETVVFVKKISLTLAELAKFRGYKIIYDPIDNFAYADRVKPDPAYKLVDTAIAYSKDHADFYTKAGWFKDAVVIPHQWDARLEGKKCVHGSFNPAYIGYGFNWKCPVQSPITLVTDPAKMLDAIPQFNCHVTLREPGSLEAEFKPATKVSTAAAVGAVIITTPDKAALEILPSNYPYWCPTIADFPFVLERARKEFGGPVWNIARAIMDKVGDKTSLKEIAKLYANL